MSVGVSKYEVAVWALDGTISPLRRRFYYAMSNTASSSNINSTSAQLSWSLRMNNYTDISYTFDFPFYLLIGTDISILSNRSTDPAEMLIYGRQKDYDGILVQITWYKNNYLVWRLQPSTTYYWRIRGLHPNSSNTYFAGGSFATHSPPCSGSISLTLNPFTVPPSGSVTPTASGLTSCTGKTINFKQGDCNTGATVSSCTSSDSGCSTTAFTAPSTAGPYSYSACIDKNGDGNTSGAGESASATLTVSDIPTPSVTGCATGAPARATGLVSTPNLISAAGFSSPPAALVLLTPKLPLCLLKSPPLMI